MESGYGHFAGPEEMQAAKTHTHTHTAVKQLLPLTHVLLQLDL